MTALDTLDYVKKLEAAGVPRQIAEAHAEALTTGALVDVATKHDITSVKQDIAALRQELSAAKAELSSDIRSVEAKLSSDIRSVEAKLSPDIRSLEQKFDGKFVLLQWMIGFTLAVCVAMLWRLLK